MSEEKTEEQNPEFDEISPDLIEEETKYTPKGENAHSLLNTHDALYWNIRARLEGGWTTIDRKTKYYKIIKPKGSKPAMNKEGIERTMYVVNAFITDIHGLSNYDKSEVLKICLQLNEDLATLYYINMEKFELAQENGSLVIRMIMVLVWSNLNRSLGARSLTLALQNERITTSRVEQLPAQNQPAKSFFGIPIPKII
jgi:hypothetical protein